MKPINLPENVRLKLFEQFLTKFKEEMDNYAFNDSASLTIKTNFGEVAKEKVIIRYTQEAFLRMQALVNFFDSEVAWYGLCERLSERVFRIYDVKVCKQTVTGAKVDTTDEDTAAFFESLTDDEANHMHFQAHSHVKMTTGASGVDLQNQHDVIHNMGKTGYYIFQIWNKNNDINTYLYDLDNNVFYDRKDVCLEIEDSLGALDDFLVSVADLVVEKKYQYNTEYYGGYYGKGYKTDTVPKKTEKKDNTYNSTNLMEGYEGMNYGGDDWD